MAPPSDSGPGEAVVGWWSSVLDVAVRACDHDLEIGTPLSRVGDGLIADRQAVEGAFVVENAWWVRLVGTWFEGWICVTHASAFFGMVGDASGTCVCTYLSRCRC